MGEVSLTVPAEPAFLHVVRSVVSGIAGLEGLSYDAIGDLSLAVSEAAGYLLGLSGSARRLSVALRMDEGMRIRLTTDTPVRNWPPTPEATLAWKILSALVGQVAFVLDEGCPAIQLAMRVNGAAQAR